MAKVSDLNVRLGLLTRDFERQLSSFERRMQGVAERMNSIGTQMSFSLSAPIAALGVASVKAFADFERLTLGLETTMQGAGRGTAEARAELEELRKAALAPGLDFEQAVKGSLRLQGVGFSAEKAREILVQLGNTLASTGGSAEQLDAVTKQFAQIAGKGRLLQEDLSIILENMPGLARVLEQEFGTTSAEAIRALGVSAESFIDRLTARMATVPRAAGGIANSITNARVAITQAAAKIGESLNKAFNITGNLDAFATWITSVADWFANLDDATKKTVLGIGVFVVALGPAVKLMSSIFSVGTTVVTTFARITEAFRLSSVAGTGTIGVFSRMNATMKANIFIAVASAVLSLVLALKAMNLGTKDATESAEIFAEQQKIITEEVGKETAALNKNFAILKNSASTVDQRRGAVEELVKTYPEYLKGIDLEKASLIELNEIQGRVSSAILKSVADRQKAIALEAEYNKIVQAQLRITQLQQQGFDALSGEEVKQAGRSVFGTEFEKGFVSAAARARVVQDVIAGLNGEIQKSTQNVSNLDREFSKTFGTTKTARDAYENAADEYGRLASGATDAGVRTKYLSDAMTGAGEGATKAGAGVKGLNAGLSESEKEAEATRKKYEELREAWSKPVDIKAPEIAVPTIPSLSLPGLDFSALEQATQKTLELSRVVEMSGDAMDTRMRGALQRVNQEIGAYNERLKLFGETSETASQRSDLLNASINRLLKAGFSAASGEVAALTNALSGTQASAKLFIETDPAAMQTAIDGLRGLAVAAQETTTTALTPLQAITDAASRGFLTMGETFSMLREQIMSDGTAMQQLVVQLGDGIAQAFDGGAQSIRGFASELVANAAQIIKNFIQVGVTKAALDALLKSKVPPPFNIALAGIAGAAASGLFGSLLGKIAIPKLAGGGVLDKPTIALLGEYAGAKNNPEIAAPESMLRQIFRDESQAGPRELFSVVRGEDILLVTDKAATRRGRVK